MASEDVVILSAARTPMGGFQGDLSGMSATELGSVAIKAAVAGEERGIKGEHLELAADQELAEARAVAAKNLSGF